LKTLIENNFPGSLRYKFFLTLVAILLIPVVLLLTSLVRSELALLSMAGIALVFLFVFNFNITLNFLVITFFINYLFFSWKVAVLFVPILLLSFLLTQQSIQKEDFRNSLTKYFIIYMLTCLPSFMNSAVLMGSLVLSLHFLAFLVVIYSIAIFMRKKEQISYYVNMFLILCLINGINVLIAVALYGGRKFGFAGLMYVDYVNIAIIINLIMVVIKRKSPIPKVVFLITLSIFVLVSVLMQTRSTWIAFAATFALLIMYFYKKSSFYNITRIKIIYFISIITLLLTATVLLSVRVTDFSERVTDIEVGEEINEDADIGNSLVTRMLIWDTALNAFTVHPYTGVGMYSFPLVSRAYARIPDVLYDKYVKNLTPHQGYFAVLAETGIIGFAGFVLMIIMIIRTAFGNVKKARNEDEKLLSTILLWILIYIAVSLAITDAWFWGVGIIVWGFFIGLMLGLKKIVERGSGRVDGQG